MAESKSWGHAIRELTANERARRNEIGWRCAFGRPPCQTEPEFEASYRYVTGRAGRVTTARRTCCREHAERFARNHELAMSEVPS